MANNKSVQILYGVGNAILREFTDEKKIVALSQLKNLSVAASASDEKIYAADNPYPLATFQKDKTITITADNANFDLKMLNVTQGSVTATGLVTMTEVESYIIPADGVINVHKTPTTSTEVVDGFTKGTDAATLTTGQYFQDATDTKKFTFAVVDAGKNVSIVYDRPSLATAETISVLKDSMAKPFKFIHRIPIYDDNTQVIGQGQLIVYKAQAKNNFDFSLAHQTAFAPKVELEALDPKRPDKKLWDFTIDYA